MGFEPTYNGFANRCLTTWLPRRSSFSGARLHASAFASTKDELRVICWPCDQGSERPRAASYARPEPFSLDSST